MHIRPSSAAGLIAAGLLIAALNTDASSVAAPQADPAIASGPVLPIGHAGTWLTDAGGRVVVWHGLNQVYKVPPVRAFRRRIR
jgi:endoglycosylceramidase